MPLNIVEILTYIHPLKVANCHFFCLFCPQASCILQLVKYIQKLQQKDVEVAEEVSALFAGELNPVAPKAQKKVPVPEGWVKVALLIHLIRL